MSTLMTGNEALARGAWEAGVRFASAYPGTPSTEILENLSTYDEICSEWAPNEKVALETVIGASFGGARSMASMKHVGVNVAADPLFTWGYTGVNAGGVILSADEPGMFSSQNEQDNRNYAKAAKIPMFEPSNSQECIDMLKEAFDISEKHDTPVMVRLTTRVCHSKSMVKLGDRKEVELKAWEKNPRKYVTLPVNSRALRVEVEKRLDALKEYTETTPLNFAEYNDTKVGFITSGVCYYYAKEAYGDKASYLKLGFTHPLPAKKIKEFCDKVDVVYVVEENDPYIEDFVRALGIECHGKDTFPKWGEMTPDVIFASIHKKDANEVIDFDKSKVIGRPPTFCAGCPHRGFFYKLGKKKNIMISGDIGCYTLAAGGPYNALDTTICMGAAFSVAHGAQKAFNMGDTEKRVVAVMGDSTFFHTGINSLINTMYNGSNTINVILDNRITGMTGHQQNPGTGFNAKGEVAGMMDIETIVKALGFKHIFVINPNMLKQVDDTIEKCLAIKDEPSVIITRWPCVLKKLSQADLDEFKNVFKEKSIVNHDKCIGCQACLKTGCPALIWNEETKKVTINRTACVGCSVCRQVCPARAISKEVL